MISLGVIILTQFLTTMTFATPIYPNLEVVIIPGYLPSHTQTTNGTSAVIPDLMLASLLQIANLVLQDDFALGNGSKETKLSYIHLPQTVATKPLISKFRFH
jgi:hypothetical protein